MRIPYKDRVDKWEVKWETVEPKEGESFKYAVITIHELWSIGHLIFPKGPLKVEVYFGDEENVVATDEKTALIVYDFGMEDRIPLENNFHADYAGNNDENNPIKTIFSSVKFDLMHAFFHYKGDPNYGHRHWALYGNLKGRVTDDDSFIFDDAEYEEMHAQDELKNKQL